MERLYIAYLFNHGRLLIENLDALIAVVGVLAVIILCAILRINLITLLPWFPGAPERLDDRVQALGSIEESRSKSDSE